MKKFLLGMFSLVLLGSFGYVSAGSIGDIQLRFCEEVEVETGVTKTQLYKHLTLGLEQGEEKDICMQITNQSKDEMTIKLGFVDGTVTNDSEKNKACKNEGEVEKFGKFMKYDGAPFTLQPGQTVEKHATLQFDASAGGEILGCVTYYQSASLEQQSNDMLKILVRKANFIDVNLSGDISAGLLWLDGTEMSKDYSNNPKIQVIKGEEKGTYEVIMSFKNIGTVKEAMTLSTDIKQMFRDGALFLEEERDVPANETVSFRKTIDNMPWYGGFVTLTADVSHQAQINFESPDVTPDMKALKTMGAEAKFFVLTIWVILIGLFVLLLIIVIIWVMVRHRHHSAEHKRRLPAHVRAKTRKSAPKIVSKPTTPAKKTAAKKPVAKKAQAKKKTTKK